MIWRKDNRMKIMQWVCKIIILICFLILLWTFLFPTFVIQSSVQYGQWEEMRRIKKFIFSPPNSLVDYDYRQRLKIDTELIWVRTVPLILIIGVGLIFLKWQSSKKQKEHNKN